MIAALLDVHRPEHHGALRTGARWALGLAVDATDAEIGAARDLRRALDQAAALGDAATERDDLRREVADAERRYRLAADTVEAQAREIRELKAAIRAMARAFAERA